MIRSFKGKRAQAVFARQVVRGLSTEDQWRVCFTWSQGDAGDVEVVDYR